ncbi:hypothetical protein PLICRDRAFT_510885 [Plicaturopsis crispa FD-325 SS-3]|nr:hypothetical protein PLICRDRAFT_510885 [Plicaturopsis crispa FD-325 SS-3]
MVLVEGSKYACETCIKGHRAASCKHIDRPLFEIKKKGRPVTQCEHCRELRKTKQIHVRCICGSTQDTPKPENAGAVSKKFQSGVPKLPASAAFPNGLPEALEASVVLEASSESDQPSNRHALCSCKNDDECHCWSVRKSAPKRKKASHSVAPADPTSRAPVASGSTTSPPPSVLARIAELRPVLPRPPDDARSLQMLSPGMARVSRHHHESGFSPYGRAFEQIHPEYAPSSASDPQLHPYENLSSNLTSFSDPPLSNGYNSSSEDLASNGRFPALCGCGESCSCPGCAQHNNPSVLARVTDPSIYSHCTNPSACQHCLDCSIMALPDLTPDLGPSAYESTQSQDIDEWLQQINALPPSSSSVAAPASQQSPELVMPWDADFQMPQIVEPAHECCAGGQGMCTCTDCQCEGRRVTTFATSGERSSCASYLSVPRAGSRSSTPSSQASGPSSGAPVEMHRSIGSCCSSSEEVGVPRTQSIHDPSLDAMHLY